MRLCRVALRPAHALWSVEAPAHARANHALLHVGKVDLCLAYLALVLGLKGLCKSAVSGFKVHGEFFVGFSLSHGVLAFS